MQALAISGSVPRVTNLISENTLDRHHQILVRRLCIEQGHVHEEAKPPAQEDDKR
jgi:hypothetical protein